MLKKWFATLCLLSIAKAMILWKSGYRMVTKKWPQFINQPKTEVQKEISKLFPNVTFAVVNEANGRISDEAYFGEIKLVVNDNDIVIETPVFSGYEPDLSLVEEHLGQGWYAVKNSVIKTFPSDKIVSYKNGKVIDVHEGGRDLDYIRIDVDPDGMVRKMPHYVRVLPTYNL